MVDQGLGQTARTTWENRPTSFAALTDGDVKASLVRNLRSLRRHRYEEARNGCCGPALVGVPPRSPSKSSRAGGRGIPEHSPADALFDDDMDAGVVLLDEHPLHMIARVRQKQAPNVGGIESAGEHRDDIEEGVLGLSGGGGGSDGVGLIGGDPGSPTTPEQAVAVDVVHQAREFTGSIISKVEIAVGFLQVYALMLALSIDVVFPYPWVDIKVPYDWLPLISAVDFFAIFARVNFKLPHEYHQYVTFFAIVGIPAVFIILFFRANGMEKERWYVAVAAAMLMLD